MTKYFDVLRRCPLFYNIKDSEFTEMLNCLGTKVRKYGKNEVVFHEGDPVRYVGIVLSGEVQIVQVDYFGNRSLVASIESSELFGESFACAGISRIPVDVIASEDTEIMLIDCLKIIQSCSNACEFHRQMIYNLMKIVAAKNLIFHQKIEIISKRSTREKLMTYLLWQAKRNNSNRFTIPYNRQELADYLGIDRSGLSVEISKLCREGVIVSRRNYFEILSVQ